jgi:hypothetical protein
MTGKPKGLLRGEAIVAVVDCVELWLLSDHAGSVDMVGDYVARKFVEMRHELELYGVC